LLTRSLSERINVGLDKNAQVFLQLVSKQPGHAYTFRSGLGNTTRHRASSEESKYEPRFPEIPLIDAREVEQLSFANAQIVSRSLISCLDRSTHDLHIF
jgi:hypothetical protein